MLINFERFQRSLLSRAIIIQQHKETSKKTVVNLITVIISELVFVTWLLSEMIISD